MELSQLNESQQIKLKQLRENVKDCELHDSSDIFLLSWLIARNFDLAKAEKMLRDSLDWRVINRINFIRDELVKPEVMKLYHPVGLIGQDKFFRPLWLIRRGREDVKGLLSSVHQSLFLKYFIYLVETGIWLGKNCPENRQSKSGSIFQATLIFDMEGFSMQDLSYKPSQDVTTQILQIYEKNYPEMLHRVFVINAPRVFSLAYKLVRPFMDERTANKILIYSEPAIWKSALLAEIDPDQLPASYGGSMLDPDGNPNCVTKCSMGGIVPKSYFLSSQQTNLIVEHSTDTDDRKCLVIPPRAKELLEFHAEKAGSMLRWNFQSKNGDLAFTVYYKSQREGNVVLIFPRSRVNCDVIAIKDEIQCERKGIYCIEFDNSFSYLRSKIIYYSITIIKDINSKTSSAKDSK